MVPLSAKEEADTQKLEKAAKREGLKDKSLNGTSETAVSEKSNTTAGASTSMSPPVPNSELDNLVQIPLNRTEEPVVTSIDSNKTVRTTPGAAEGECAERERLMIETQRLVIETNQLLVIEKKRAKREPAERDLMERERLKWPRRAQTTEKEMNILVDLKYDVVGDTPEERRKKRVLRMTLKESKDTVQVLEGKVDRRNSQIDGLKFEIYQLGGLFSVFSGVVFTAVTQPNRLERQHIWSPLALCVFAYVVITAVTISKFSFIETLQTTNSRDYETSKSLKKIITKLKTIGHERFTFAEVPEESGLAEHRTPHTAKRVSVSVLFGFSLLLWASILHIILTKGPSCDECLNWCPYAPSPAGT